MSIDNTTSHSQDAKLQQAAEIITGASRVAALTGAGISTPSGIPDFRSAGSGLWSQVDALEVASIFGYRRNPLKFYSWVRPLLKTILEAEPNPAHKALADLEACGLPVEIVTQNIDLLHSKAGSTRVHEIHGHIRTLTCPQCRTVYQSDLYLSAFVEQGTLPRCPKDDDLLKPDVVLFGELLPLMVMEAAQCAIQTCDVLLIVGSSLEVSPASDLPLLAHQNNAAIIMINAEPTHIDRKARVVFHDDAAIILPAIVKRVDSCREGT